MSCMEMAMRDKGDFRGENQEREDQQKKKTEIVNGRRKKL